jgi:hypothetical protein
MHKHARTRINSPHKHRRVHEICRSLHRLEHTLPALEPKRPRTASVVYAHAPMRARVPQVPQDTSLRWWTASTQVSHALLPRTHVDTTVQHDQAPLPRRERRQRRLETETYTVHNDQSYTNAREDRFENTIQVDGSQVRGLRPSMCASTAHRTKAASRFSGWRWLSAVLHAERCGFTRFARIEMCGSCEATFLLSYSASEHRNHHLCTETGTGGSAFGIRRGVIFGVWSSGGRYEAAKHRNFHLGVR